jgi:prephenate dehydrogenase
MIKQPLIVGYKGEIGSFILNGLLRVMPKALDIWCIDVNETESEIKHRIGMSDVIFLCTPMQITMDWLIKNKEELKGKIIIEQSSLKEWLGDERLSDLDIRSMHILFKPSQTPNKEDRKVGFIKGQFSNKMANEIVGLLSSKEAIWYDNIKDHDKEMAIQQALVHRALIVLGSMLDSCNGSTYIVKRVKELRDRIQSGDKGLYGAIQRNPHVAENLDEFVRRMESFDIGEYWK